MPDWQPVIIGVAQVVNRKSEPAAKREPLLLMEEACAGALADCGSRRVRARIESVRVVNVLSVDYRDPARALGERLGLSPGERLYTTVGGNTPQWLVNQTADELVTGKIRVALLAGGEAMHAIRVSARHGVALDWERGSGRAPRMGDPRPGSHPDEWRHGAHMPAHVYPLFEVALRAHAVRTPSAHGAHIAALSAGLAQVAAAHPCAWFRDAPSAAEIGQVTPKNRMIAFPYTKRMNAMMEVDQGAALLMTTAEEARRLGVPSERWIYVHGGGAATDLWYLRDRVDYYSSPGMVSAFEQAFEQAEVSADDVAVLDLYSCFPAAVQLAAEVLGLGPADPRPLTVTGGLPYFGGPGNNYTMHAIATMVERLRAQPEALGLVSGVGWYMTKHAVGIYGARPPVRPWSRARRADRQAAIDALTHPHCVERADGRAAIETYTVVHGRGGAPEYAIVIARLPGGERIFAQTEHDEAVLAALERDDMVGTIGDVSAGKGHEPNRFRPLGA